jgi:aromatic ring-opening dioxygenase catalytic subunit (LigB family)
MQITFISHGGGPMPLLNDPGHQNIIDHWQSMTKKFDQPRAILLISAHWESDIIRVNGLANPDLLYDYYGFPPETYEIKYPCPGEPELAQHIVETLNGNGMPAELELNRGLDHGVFVPLKKMYPNADIPVVEISLLHSLDPASHLAMGKVLQKIIYPNLLIIGSGFSLHNMQWLRSPDLTANEAKNFAFQQWLSETCSRRDLDESERNQKLIDWATAPNARLCMPREEHLLPLHVCVGAAGRPSDQSDIVDIHGLSCSNFSWF